MACGSGESLATSDLSEQLFEVGPLPEVASGSEENAWLGFCTTTATGYKVEFDGDGWGGFTMDISQPDFDEARSDRAVDYCLEEGFARGHLKEPTEEELQTGFEEQLATNQCLIDHGFDMPEPPSTLEEYQSTDWEPFSRLPKDLKEDEVNELHLACQGDETVTFVDWEP